MKGVIKKILWLGVIAGLIYLGYQAYKNWWDKEEIAKGVTKVARQAEAKVKTEAENFAQKYVKKFIKKPVELAKDYSKEAAAEVLVSLEKKLEKVADSLGGGSSGGGSSGGGSSTASKNTTSSLKTSSTSTSGSQSVTPTQKITPESLISPPSATLTTKAKAPLIFSLNSGTKEANYKIAWGDNKIEESNVAQGQVKLIAHSWSKEGDYVISIEIYELGQLIHTYLFPVKVYPVSP